MPIQPEQRYYLKLKALYLLYEKNYTQVEISKMLGISRVTLNKMLDEAKREGLVKIEIVDVKGTVNTFKLEEQMKELFGLSDVRLVANQGEGDSGLVRRMAAEAAAYLERILRSGMRLGFSWGRMLNTMEEYLNENHAIQDLDIYSLVGGSYSVAEFQPNLLIQRVVEKYGGVTHILTAPYMCQTPELCQAIKQEPQIARILEEANNLDITMVGIGEKPPQGAESFSYYPFDASIIEELVNANAVGDICGNFYDIHGQLCQTSLTGRIISVDIRQLIHQKRVIGVAGGENKVESILGALNGGFLDVLITDMVTAKSVIELSKSADA